MSIVVVSPPPELFAYTVYVWVVDNAVGVPVICPVFESILKPFGKLG